MKKSLIILSTTMLLGITIFNSCKKSSSTPNSPTNQNSNSVIMSNITFSPSSLTVSKGTTVTWTNKDNVTHTVTSDNGVFDSGDLTVNKTFSYTFNTSGTFNYHCKYHPGMVASVTVQ
ncbi:MAG: cupredoxin domain-containing protein [Bacteroidota bacterium]|nr:cupredoxin domain-containing protein [Bacteroidota bacterium]